MASKVPTRPFRPGDEKSVPLAPPTPTTDSCPSLEKFEINEKSSLDEGVPSHELADLKNIVNPARKLNRKQLGLQRSVFILFVLCVNIGLGYVATRVYHGAFILAFIVFVKAKDFTYASISMIGLIVQKTYRYFNPPEPVTRKWILSLIPAYSESEEQILKCITSLQTNGAAPHRQVMVVLLDGNPRDIRSHMTRVILEIERPYVSLKYKLSSLKVTAGWIGDAPVIVLEKSKNSGKKDSLVLCHDIFNFPRSNMPILTKILKEEIWRDVLPAFTNGEGFNGFDMVFCTDADSIVHKGAIAHLANAMARDEKAIAACGLVLVELEPGYEWSFWNLFQQVQYTYGQFIRRRAEGFIGRVTCLPGCVTMTAVRKEMAGAIQKYAEPVTAYSVLHHQVQYLGTDRRLTYCMLSQSTNLHTLFVPEAVSETVAPQSLKHYLSQRRRWGSNAYFNNFFYCGGIKMIFPIRMAATIDLARETFAYYRVLNTALFIRALVTHFNVMEILPLLVVGQLPLVCYFLCVFIEPELRKRAHKIIIGLFINKLISPFLSLTVFTTVALNLGSQAWGLSGITATSPPSTPLSQRDNLSAAEEGRAGSAVAAQRELPI